MQWLPELITGVISFAVGALIGVVGAYANFKFTERLNRQKWDRQMEEARRQEARQIEEARQQDTEKRLEALINAVGTIRIAIRSGNIGEDAYGQAANAFDSAYGFFRSGVAAQILGAFRDMLDAADNFTAAQQGGDTATAQEAAELVSDFGDNVVDEIRCYREAAGTAG